MALSTVFLILLVSLVASSNIFTLSQGQHSSYSQWKSSYGKTYQSGEVEAYRLNLWVQNYNKIENHNANYREGKVSYFVALNQFSDIPYDELQDSLFYENVDGISNDLDTSSLSTVCSVSDDPETTFQLQQQQTESFTHLMQSAQFSQIQISSVCASGWANAVSQTLSIALSNKARTLKLSQVVVSLSPQQLIDCANFSSQLRCSMGSLTASWSYYLNYGAVLNSLYPYQNQAGVCNTAVTRNPSFRISGCKIVSPNSERSLRHAVALTPVISEINGKAFGFVYYGGGIYDAVDCYQEELTFNHAVNVIGYDYQVDFDELGNPEITPYWQVSNSFGTNWGENGYMRIASKFLPYCQEQC